MSGILGNLRRASFDFISFACSSFSVRGGARIHQHEYRHTPGSVLEKLGRRAYMIDFNAFFSTQTRTYPDAFPGDFSDLVDRFDRMVTSELVVPILGAIQAVCVDWPIDVDYARMRDGVRVKLSFLEDTQNELIQGGSVMQLSPTIMAMSAEKVVDAAEATGVDTKKYQSLVELAEQIDELGQDAANVGQAYIDAVSEIVSACQSIHDTAAELADPVNWPVAQSVRKLGAQAIKLRSNMKRRARPLSSFTTDRKMSVVEVAILLYADASRAVEIMQLNSLDDPLNIPTNTTLRVYASDLKAA